MCYKGRTERGIFYPTLYCRVRYSQSLCDLRNGVGTLNIVPGKLLKNPHANDHRSSVCSYGSTNKVLHFVCLYVSPLLIHNEGTFFEFDLL